MLWKCSTLPLKNVRRLNLHVLKANLTHRCSPPVIATVHTATAEDVDDAVKAASKAFENTWGLNVAGSERGRLLYKLADVSRQGLPGLDMRDQG